ncbi:achaete-scute homolog 3 [Mantella aurantiaca]
MESAFSHRQKMAPGGDPLNALQWSLTQFGLDTSPTFPFPVEAPPFPLPQDLALLSYYDPTRMDYYYGALALAADQRRGGGGEIYGPAYIRKRNERERQRVKCVNEGYAKLRRHLPREYAEKRLSKVQTLRAAIRYIVRLQEALRWGGGGGEGAAGSPQPAGKTRKIDTCHRRNASDFLKRSGVGVESAGGQ